MFESLLEPVKDFAIAPVLDQHMEDTSFNWAIRDSAVSEPHYDVNDLADIDSMVSAGLLALGAARGPALDLCIAAAEQEVPGAVFAATFLALRGDNGGALAPLLDNEAETTDPRLRELASAAAWCPKDDFAKWVPGLSRSATALGQYLLVSTGAKRREKELVDFDLLARQPGTATTARLLRAAGELKIAELRRQLSAFVQSEDDKLRFWSAWSLALLGDRSIGETLKAYVETSTSFARRSIDIAPRILAPDDCRDWLKSLAQEESLRRHALMGCGITGDPVYIPTLINQMTIPEYARVAGEAFSMITGVDLAYDDLNMDAPEDYEAGPTDDPADDNVELDQDENLPWPNPDLLDRWWREHGGSYQPGTRYLCGQPISEANCQRVLREGFQRQRISAAYELALLKPDAPLFEWRAPGWRQQRWLGLRNSKTLPGGSH